MNIDNLNCPSCKEQYTQVNPPRLLTMCGHSFCHKCIKTLITKKKDKGFRIKCPIDKGSMEMEKPNPSLFPKNIALIELLNKNNGEFTSNQFLDVSLVEKSISYSEKEGCSSETQIQGPNLLNQKQQDPNVKICPEHSKVMEVYCVEDCQIICTDCALFSHHRSHEVKNLSDILKLEQQKMQELSLIIKNKQQADEKFMSKEIEGEIFDLLDKKKKLIQGEISSFFNSLRKLIDKKESELKDELETKGLITAEKMRDKMKRQKEAVEKYKVWEDEVNLIINESLQNTPDTSCKRLQNLIRSCYYEDKMSEGKEIIEKMSRKEEDFIGSFEETLNCFTFSSNLSDVELAISRSNVTCELQANPNKASPIYSKHSRLNSYVQHINPDIKTVISQKNLFSNSKDTLWKTNPGVSQKQKQNYPCQPDDEEESLLDFDTNYQSKALRTSTASCNIISNISVNSNANDGKIKKNIAAKAKKVEEPVRRMNSSQVATKSRSNSVRSSTTSIKSLERQKAESTSKSKKNESRFKYQSLIEDIKSNKIDTVDMTGAEPRPQELTMILQAINESQSIKTVKLMRNKLDDSFIEKGVLCLLKVERVNLAQNKFSQVGVDEALSILKKHPEHKMVSLNMGQNRIVERKNRKVLDEFKKLNVAIVL